MLRDSSDFLKEVNDAIDTRLLQDENGKIDASKLKAIGEDLKKLQRKEKIENELRTRRVKKIPTWLKEGYQNIHPDLIANFEEDVTSWALNGEGSARYIDLSLEIIKQLKEEKKISEVKKILEEYEKISQSKKERPIIQSIVFNYSIKGPEFVEATLDRPLKPSEVEVIYQKKEENIRRYKKKEEASTMDQIQENSHTVRKH